MSFRHDLKVNYYAKEINGIIIESDFELCRLVETLELVLEQYGVELPQLAELPASIKLDQAVAAWKYIMQYYAKRH